MAPESFSVSAPGKLFLLGEHAVLHGYRCLVCAVDQRMRVRVTPRSDSMVRIRSDLGEHQTNLKDLTPHIKFSFVLAAIRHFQLQLQTGFELDITSDFHSTLGLGSSAAVTVAVTAAMYTLTGLEWQKRELFNDSLSIVRRVQGGGSGADLAAAVHGGVLLYRADPLELAALENIYPISVVYSGSKMPTMQVVRRVEAARKRLPRQFSHIYQAMDASAADAAEAITSQTWPRLGEILNLNQGLMDAVGVSNHKLASIVYALRQDANILGSKISGSGLGDCVLGLGETGAPVGYDILPIQMSSDGVKIDET